MSSCIKDLKYTEKGQAHGDKKKNLEFVLVNKNLKELANFN